MLEVKNLCKHYPKFDLVDVSFELPTGYIMGFIGMNGAGKTTTLKSILNIVRPDNGEVKILGKDMSKNEIEIKKEIGFMFGPMDCYSHYTIKKVADVYKRFFDKWDDSLYENYLTKFNIDENKKISDLSAGMKVKLGIAFALSHEAKLIILDEPTSGLDPIARDELLDIMREVIANGDKSILFSTHITSDLDKCADFIIFIRNGKLIANSTKDDLINKYYVLSGKKADLTNELKSKLIGLKNNEFGFSGLIERKDFEKDSQVQKEKPNLEDLMIYLNREEDK